MLVYQRVSFGLGLKESPEFEGNPLRIHIGGFPREITINGIEPQRSSNGLTLHDADEWSKCHTSVGKHGHWSDWIWLVQIICILYNVIYIYIIHDKSPYLRSRCMLMVQHSVYPNVTMWALLKQRRLMICFGVHTTHLLHWGFVLPILCRNPYSPILVGIIFQELSKLLDCHW